MERESGLMAIGEASTHILQGHDVLREYPELDGPVSRPRMFGANRAARPGR
jgi:hypothetical protein